MRRREFITLFGAVAWPLAAWAQQPAMPVIGFLRSTSLVEFPHLTTAFRHGLNEMGFVESQNVTIEFRSAEDRHDRLAGLVADLVRRRVNVIVGNAVAAIAAKAATTTIPIVFGTGADPVKLGLVASLNRPESNVTGVSFFGALAAKQLQLLREVVPKADRIAVLINPTNPAAVATLGDVQDAAARLGARLIVFKAASEIDIDEAFTTFVQQRAVALVVYGDALFTSQLNQLVALATRHSVPTIYFSREFPVAGGLMSYGSSLADACRHVGIYVGRILKGAKPADLPVQQAVKFDLVINVATAKRLGLEIPPTLLAIADEVIE
jgi:ABC-type uncharacterized transport system substrate-binding protein